MVTQVKRLFSAIGLVALIAWAAGVSAMDKLIASVDRNPVMERESFVLKIQANDSVNTNDLDLSALYSAGFVVGRTATGSQTQIINGSIEKSTTWSVVLTAKKAGTYTIPAFTLKGISSQPIQLEVVKGSTNKALSNKNIFIQNQLEETEVYVQQTIKLTTKLYISPQVELQSGSLSEPGLEGAFIQQQGKDRDGSEIINGIRYRVIERVYTITPQASGDFKIESPAFNGDIATVDRRRSMFSTFKQSKPISTFGEDFEISVKPIPDDYVGAWLPSTIVQLNEEWQPDKTTFEVGEAITRTITLTALNVNEEQLPEIDVVYPDSVKVYPDQSDTASVIRQSSLVSQRTMSNAIIPNQAGEITLPAIEVSWFNTILKRAQTVKLPARVITVIPPKNSPNSNTLLSQPDLNDVAGQSANIKPSSADTVATSTKLSLLHWVWIIAGWCLALVFVILYIRQYKETQKLKLQLASNAQTATGHEKQSSDFNIKGLKSACLANQATLTQALLERWLLQQRPGAKSINEVLPHLTEDLKNEVNSLLSYRYAPASDSQWHGAKLWQAISKQLKAQNQQKSSDENSLPPLNYLN